MKHPLSSFGNYSGSGDFDRSGIDKVDADFSAGNVVNASEDFGKQCMSGDFGVDYGEDYFQGGFEGYGHFDHFLGDYDEGLGKKKGFKVKIKKPKFKSPIKSIAKVAQAPLKSASKIANPFRKNSGGFKKFGGIKLPKQALKIQQQVLKKAQGMANIAKIVPGSSQVQALAQKAAQAVSKAGIPIQAIAPALANFVSPKATVRAVPESYEESETQESVAPIQEVVAPIQEVASSTPTQEVKVNGQYAHPLLFTSRRLKGEAFSGFLDDLMAAQKKAVQKAIDTNKAKLIAAGTTQLSNVVGKQLDKFTKSDPKAAAAIQNVVSQATETATAKAKQGISDTLKASFEQNKKAIFAVGGGILALVALKMFMKRKA
jgi:hypothetical protein